MWHLAHQCLPTRVNLLTRGIPCEETCVCYGTLVESHMHMFFVCSNPSNCWKQIGLHSLVKNLLLMAHNVSVMLFELLNRLSLRQQSLVATILWSLWKNRNSKLWEDIDNSSGFIVTRAKTRINEWSCMQRVKLPMNNVDTSLTWSRPPEGTIKCNVDAAFFNNNSIMGYVICFRNSSGVLILGKSAYYYSSHTVLEAEIIGLLEAIKEAIST